MIAVIFEVVPNPGHREEYLDIAAKLKPLLTDIPGFISIERFQSLSDPNKLLSLSFWADEQAVAQYRSASSCASERPRVGIRRLPVAHCGRGTRLRHE